MKIKKILYAGISSMIILSLLVGCSGKSKEIVKTDSSKSTDTMQGNMFKQGLPIVKDTMTFKLFARTDARMPEFNQMLFFKEMEQKTNVHIEWDLVEYNDYQQKKSISLASGTFPDAYYNVIDNKDMALYEGQGVFIKLDKLIEDYAPNITAAFKQNPIYKRVSASLDGSIYNIADSGNGDLAQYNPDQLFMYKPWLDKLGLKVPTSIDEFYAVLKAFKEKDPNGNGKADEIPFSFRNSSHIQGLHSLFAAFGRADYVFNDKAPTVIEHFVVEDGKVVFAADKPEFKEAIKFMNKCFGEKLFDQEGFTQSAAQYLAKGKTKDVTIGSFMLWNAQNLAGAERMKDYVIVGPLKGPSGKANWTKYNSNNGTMEKSFSITKECKNPEVLVRWIDYHMDKKIGLQQNYGPIGYALQENAKGIYEMMPMPTGMTLDEFRRANAPLIGPKALFTEDMDKLFAGTVDSVLRNKITKDIYEPFQKSHTLPVMMFTTDEMQWLTGSGLDVQNYVNQNRNKWMLDGGIDQEWDTYVKKLNQLNLVEYTKKLQTAYDRFTKN